MLGASLTGQVVSWATQQESSLGGDLRKLGAVTESWTRLLPWRLGPCLAFCWLICLSHLFDLHLPKKLLQELGVWIIICCPCSVQGQKTQFEPCFDSFNIACWRHLEIAEIGRFFEVFARACWRRHSTTWKEHCLGLVHNRCLKMLSPESACIKWLMKMTISFFKML